MSEEEFLTAWWRYGLGIWSWDRGEPQFLADVVASGYVCPPQLAPVLGDILAGRRKPNKRAAAKFKLSSMKAAIAACRLAAVINRAKAQQGRAEHLGDRWGVEPSEAIAASQSALRRAKAELAAQAGISVESLEENERALRRVVETLTSH